MQRPVTNEVLIEASHHVEYEIKQFASCTAVLRRDFWEAIPTFMARTAQNALLEAWTVHFRAIYDFLDFDPKDDDMGASDWFPDGRWPSLRQGPAPGLAKARKRVNKDIAHLTYDRLKRAGDAVFWPHETVVDALRSDLFVFLEKVESDSVRDGFKGAIWQALPWITTGASFVRFDPSVIQPVATTGFGIPVAAPRPKAVISAASRTGAATPGIAVAARPSRPPSGLLRASSVASPRAAGRSSELRPCRSEGRPPGP
jgi:hypothetical protein